MGGLEQLDKARKHSSLEPPEGTQPCPHHDFSPVRSISDFWPPKRKEDRFVFFWTIKLRVICYSSNRKIIHSASERLVQQWYTDESPLRDWRHDQRGGSCNCPTRRRLRSVPLLHLVFPSWNALCLLSWPLIVGTGEFSTHFLNYYINSLPWKCMREIIGVIPDMQSNIQWQSDVSIKHLCCYIWLLQKCSEWNRLYSF